MSKDVLSARPFRIINSVAPIRIADNGGWTDTWFARHGKIFNIGVYPYAEVQIEVFPSAAQEDRIIVQAENFGERFAVFQERTKRDRHPLLEAAIQYMRVPHDVAVQVTIFSEAPAGGIDRHIRCGHRRAHRSTRPAHPGEDDTARGCLRSASRGDDDARAAVRHPGPALFGVWRHQLHRDAGFPPRDGIADPGFEFSLVGAGTETGSDLLRKVSQFLRGPQEGDPRSGGRGAGVDEN